jgi:hypothetical protein
MRLDTRVTRNYVDDQRCEMLAHGMLNYFKALLRDDLDRTWGKYENRDTAVGFVSKNYSHVDDPEVRVPGLLEYVWGTPVSNDIWFSAPYHQGGHSWGDLYAAGTIATYGIQQQSFSWTQAWTANGMLGRCKDPTGSLEFDCWLNYANNCWDSQGRVVSSTHPDARSPIDDDGDGSANPPYSLGGADRRYGNEISCVGDYYCDAAPLVIYTGPTYYQPGPRMTGETMLPGGIYWRWGVKVGPTHSMYANLNVHGNTDAADLNSQGLNAYLNNMGGLGLLARRSVDETDSIIQSDHLGCIEWRGFPGEYEYVVRGGFPRYYNSVMYAPAAASLEKLFHCHEYAGWPPASWGGARPPDVGADRAGARALIRYRWGGGTGIPADGKDYWRVGWRRDAATYYKFPSPENPMASDRYFGANEVIEHDHSVDHPGTSAVARILGDTEWRKLRPYLTMWSTDTILRGKIWPTEGPPYTSTPGDWHHMDILKRVNLNMIGAKGPEGLPGEDTVLKNRWAAKAAHERDRLYYMLLGAMRFTNTPDAKHKACQFIASLADMIDRDHSETYYEAPDLSGACALGVEKHPVINEVVFYSRSAANTANYELFRVRVELYNPMENIPWIKDTDEAYDISNYVLRVASHNYRLGDLTRFTTEPNTVHPDGMVIGADGMYGNPLDATADKKSWKRYAHIGWSTAVNFPPDLTRLELEGRSSPTDPNFTGVKVSLWKPLYGDAEAKVPLDAGKVDIINGRKHICVDHTGQINLVRPYGGSTGLSGPGGTQGVYLGIYRRWDPMNARVWARTPPGPGVDEQSSVLWCPGWNIGNYPTLGRPNTDYPKNASTTPPPASGTSAYRYERRWERNFKIVDGDLPSIGWLGELMMWNCAQNGPLTWMHEHPQPPKRDDLHPSLYYEYQNDLDTLAKFNLQRPFAPATDPVNLHVLDVFTVWDPSNDGIDNDGDGAIDDDDTGCQPGDKGGPEVRVFGKFDLNLLSSYVMTMAFPDDEMLRQHGGKLPNLSVITYYSYSQRGSGCSGPFETIGDLVRSDNLTSAPSSVICGYGLSLYSGTDDDGDGITDERDERDLIFTWISNYYTTRSSVFEVDLNVQLCEPPYYPDKWLPFRAYRTRRTYARKQLLGILDRSTALRVAPDGTCDFSGPIGTRMLRTTDDLIVY